MKPLEVVHQAANLGLTLKPVGNKLLVYGERCTEEFANILRQHKRGIMAILESRPEGLRIDEAAWLFTARQILDGEFEGCDRSTRESLIIGLRSIRHATTLKALDRLKAQKSDESPSTNTPPAI